MWNTSSRRIFSKTARVGGSSSDDLTIDGEAAGRRLLGDVQEGQHALVGFVLDMRDRRGRARRGAGCSLDERLGEVARARSSAAPRSPEQVAVVQLVDRVLEIQPSQAADPA